MKKDAIDFEAAQRYENAKFNALVAFVEDWKQTKFDFDSSKLNKEKQEYDKKISNLENKMENKLYALEHLNLDWVKEIKLANSSLSGVDALFHTYTPEKIQENQYV